MRRSVRRGIQLLCAALCFGAPSGATTLTSAGDASHGFIATKALPSRGPMGFLPGSGATRESSIEISSIYHLPEGLEAGSIRRGPDVLGTPSAMTTRNGRLVMVFEPDGEERGGHPTRRVRALTVRQGAVEATYLFEPMGREPEALASLPGDGALRGLAMGAWGPVALLQGVDGEDMARVLALRGIDWENVGLPPEAMEAPVLRLTTFRGDPTLIARAGEAGWAWTLRRSNGEEWAWDRSSITPPNADESVIGTGTDLVAWSSGAAGSVRLRLLRERGAYPLTSVEGVSERFAVVPGASKVSVVWLSREARDGAEREVFRVSVVSTVSGKALYEGPARTGTGLSGRDLQTLALLAGALMLTAMVFVLRPSPQDAGVVALPEGTALAEVWRRAVGLLIDLAPGLAVAAFVFGVSAEDLAAAAMLATSAQTKSVVALLVGVALTGAHEVVGEWLTGRSLGKWATGCRVVTAAGGKPAFWQALVRTTLKLSCPPLALFVVLDTRRRHPADILARTVVVMRAPEPREPPHEGGE